MGTKRHPGQFDCHEALEDDEPFFTLVARDHSAPETVRHWALQRTMAIARNEKPMDDMRKVEEALVTANAMERWAKEKPRPHYALQHVEQQAQIEHGRDLSRFAVDPALSRAND